MRWLVLVALAGCETVTTADCNITAYVDLDDDGFGGPEEVEVCEITSGLSDVGGDCDDFRADVNPASVETCDGIDNDCNLEADDGLPLLDWYVDRDDDGYGDDQSKIASCAAPLGFVADPADCDDNDHGTHPNAQEIVGDGIDQDCDGTAD